VRALRVLLHVPGRCFVSCDGQEGAPGDHPLRLAGVDGLPTWLHRTTRPPRSTRRAPLSRVAPARTTSFADVFSQVIAGTRQSVMIALIVGFFCTVISVIVGISAANMGGIVDDGLSL